MSVIYFLVVYIVVLPITTFLHELGHALPTLMTTNQPVMIYLGGFRDARSRVQLGRLTIVFAYSFHPMSPVVGRIRADWSTISPQYQFPIIVGGPLVSLGIVIITSIFTFVSRGTLQSQLAQFVAEATFIQFLLTAIPMTYPQWMGAYAGLPSDGRRLQQLWQSLRQS